MDSLDEKIKNLKLRIVQLQEDLELMKKENKKLKCTLSFMQNFLKGDSSNEHTEE